ncbi:hypothetical protein DEE89_12070 [Ralstonia pickettii]|nr:hypothetical protein [Ralstonia pickettii]MBA9852009.1 hypothetical protein [Ralstonia pickettii]MBA9919976.1 hypothetical protein [Ralstonia pickettii]MBA9959078.1 hypothetical protein [Ralstonia pickettii]MBA9964544.1 hypothetical protein [Ralstonia pickettii]
MQLSSPIDAVASAVHHAALAAFPDVHYRTRDYEAMKNWTSQESYDAVKANVAPEKAAVRRPDVRQCEIYAMFVQTWSSTALGFGGLGGQAMTPAYTVVVSGPSGHWAVYWAGRFAYLIDPHKQTDKQREAFLDDLQRRFTAERREASDRYGACSELPLEI